MNNKMKCRICKSNSSKYIYNLTILEKYVAEYYKCSKCGYVQVENPFWLDQIYNEAPIAESDEGLLYRNKIVARLISVILYFYNRGIKCIDIGGGYGVLTRMLRDYGFDCYWFDPYCKNIFAEKYSYKPGMNYNSFFLIEVVEHLLYPLEYLDKFINSDCNSFFISTKLYNGEFPEKSWKYLALNSGQHIGFFNVATLEYIGDKYNMNYFSIGDLHYFSKKKINKFIFYKIIKVNRLASFYIEKKQKPLLDIDNR